MLGAGLGEIANRYGGLLIEGDYNVFTNFPPLFDGTGREGLCYRVYPESGARNFSSIANAPNFLQLFTNDLVIYTLGKWAKIDKSFADTLSGFTTEIELYAAIAALKSSIGANLLNSQKVDRAGDLMTGTLQIMDSSGHSIFLNGASIKFTLANDNHTYFDLSSSRLNFYKVGKGTSVSADEVICPHIKCPINVLPDGNLILDAGFQNTYAIATSNTRTISLYFNPTISNEGVVCNFLIQQDNKVGGWQPAWDSSFIFPYNFDKRLNAAINEFTGYSFLAISGSMVYLSGGRTQSPG